MLHLLRERMRNLLLASQVGVLAVAGAEGPWAMPVRYRVNDLDLDCLVPRWSDIAWHLQPHPGVAVLVIVLAAPAAPLCWLQYQGRARPLADPDWGTLLPAGTSEALAEEMYLVLRVLPERIDLLDESRGWGARETLEIGETHR